MAEGVLFGIAGNVLTALGSSAFQELSLACNPKSEFDKLKGTISTIKAVLLDAEERHNNKDNQVTVWLKRLRDLIYDVDDLLDEFSTQVLRRKAKKGNAFINEVCVFFSKSNQLAYSMKMGHRIKALRQKLDAIANDRLQFQFSDHRPIESRTYTKRETCSVLNTKKVIGRDHDKRVIIELLLEKTEEKIKVVPIVGIGGLGKTTLAQMVFDDENIKRHFELSMWVCVSDRFEVKLVVEKLLAEATKANIQQNSSLEELQIGLREAIEGKKYLLVLDDVWNEDAEKWCMVKNLLVGGAIGSAIVVTTRIEFVARIIAGTPTMPSYSLEGLSKNESLCLFKQIAFENPFPTTKHLGPEIEIIGEKIMERCAGVPLAITAIGRVLWLKKSKLEWSRVLDNVTQHGTGIEPILRLSYDHLPSHLKQCFAYCSLFPKDYRINRRDLINLWMAQGFIQSSNTVEALEDVGHDNFMDLLWRSFFQEVEDDKLGNIKSCKMHDLMHDLAKSVAGVECSLTNPVDVENVDLNTRHLSLNKEIDSLWKIPDALLKASKVRTFFLPFSGDFSESNINAIVRSFSCLRVLGLRESTFEKLPHSICRLKRLRCLDLSGNKNIKELPDCMTRLHNLQTLKLTSCSNLEELPRNIGNMMSLKHIELDECSAMRHMPCGIGQLSFLRTLDLFVVGEKDKHIGGLSELKALNNLQGKLQILNLKNAIPETEAACLKEKTELESLELSWSGASMDDEMVLQSLQPHQNLKKLEIYSYDGPKLSNWLSFITNLFNISIVNCGNCRVLPPLEHLPSLKDLNLWHLGALEHISEAETYTSTTTFFPSLQNLTIHFCPNLKGWWRREYAELELLPCFPCLSNLSIYRCPDLASLPLFPTVKDLFLYETSGRLLKHTTRTRGNMSFPLSSLKSLVVHEVQGVEFALNKFLQNCECSSLEFLNIGNCSELTRFPEQVHKHALTSLKELCVLTCPNLTALPHWISNLTSLEEIGFYDCNKLQSLPEGMSRLTNLRKIQIFGCPQLTERCQRDKGPDWVKISHIPDIKIRS